MTDHLPLVSLDDIAFDEAGLVPTVVQQHDSGEVLMVAWMDAEAVRRTLDTGQTVFWSRSRQEYWHKGATSGNTQRLVDLRVDCDADVLLARVESAGPACHTGEATCFHRRVDGGPTADPMATAPDGTR